MMTHLPKVENAPLPSAEPDQSCQQARTPEKHLGVNVELPAPTEPTAPTEAAAARSGAPRSFRAETPVDLVQEGANMLALQMRQSRCVTSLSISSLATRALLRQF